MVDASQWPIENTYNFYPDEQLGEPWRRIWRKSEPWSESLAMKRWDRALAFFYEKDSTNNTNSNEIVWKLAMGPFQGIAFAF